VKSNPIAPIILFSYDLGCCSSIYICWLLLLLLHHQSVGPADICILVVLCTASAKINTTPLAIPGSYIFSCISHLRKDRSVQNTIAWTSYSSTRLLLVSVRYLLDCVLHVLSAEAKSGLVSLWSSLWWNENETNELQPGLLAEFVVPESRKPTNTRGHPLSMVTLRVL
jgi:hypothetical protein